jgi:hypothetical protein
LLLNNAITGSSRLKIDRSLGDSGLDRFERPAWEGRPYGIEEYGRMRM